MTPSADGRACCAACQHYFRVDEMDIVGYGTGYRCLRCSEGVKAAEQAVVVLEEAETLQRQRRWWGSLFDLFK